MGRVGIQRRRSAFTARSGGVGIPRLAWNEQASVEFLIGVALPFFLAYLYNSASD